MALTKVTSGMVNPDPTNASNLSTGDVPLAQLGNAPSTDLTPLQNDIAVLALHSAVQNNQTAHNLSNAFIDQYEDSTGIDGETGTSRDVAGEYVSSVTLTGQTTTIGGNAAYSTVDKKMGDGSLYLDGTSATGISVPLTNITTGDYTAECWYKQTSRSGTDWIFAVGDSTHPPGMSAGQSGTTTMQLYGNSNAGGDSYEYASWSTESATTWKHIAIVRDTSLGAYPIKMFDDGVWRTTATSSYIRTIAGRTMIGFRNGAAGTGSDQDFFTGYIDEFRLSDNVRYTGTFAPQTTAFTPDANTKVLWHMDSASLLDESTQTVGATGNYTSTTQTANSTVSNIGIVVLYKNQAGTTTLNTDLVVQVSADGGSNYVSAPVTAAGTFSTGILIAESASITISNTGTTPKFKISFANQASGSKETRVYGAALLY
jgi:hypothetical protein